jgi:hypothetical protein
MKTVQEKLDILLEFIKVESKGLLRGNFNIDELKVQADILPLDGDEKNTDSLSILFDRLVDDNLVKAVESSGKPQYRITSQGLLFMGYVSKKEQEDREKLLQMLPIWVTAIGTGISGLYFLGKFFLWLCGY